MLETSGVADVEPLASMLTSSGFKLAGVVTVVDAEAGSSQLQHEDVALAQVGWREDSAAAMYSATNQLALQPVKPALTMITASQDVM